MVYKYFLSVCSLLLLRVMTSCFVDWSSYQIFLMFLWLNSGYAVGAGMPQKWSCAHLCIAWCDVMIPFLKNCLIYLSDSYISALKLSFICVFLSVSFCYSVSFWSRHLKLYSSNIIRSSGWIPFFLCVISIFYCYDVFWL